MPLTLEDLKNKQKERSIFQNLEGKSPEAIVREAVLFCYEWLVGKKPPIAPSDKPDQSS